VWESGRRRYLSYVLGTNSRLVALIPSGDLFVCARDLFDGAIPRIIDQGVPRLHLRPAQQVT